MKTWIKSLETTDGHLRDAKISLAEGLTCIIGARGTCKSTIVETIRFVHEFEHARSDDETHLSIDSTFGQNPTELLKATLANGTAACTIQITDEHRRTSEIRIERSLGTSSPRIYRDGVLEPLSSPDLPIEIYSQGDLVKITEDPQRRLHLVDRPHARKIEQIKEKLRNAQEKIARLGGEILKLRASLREEGRNLAQLPELEAQLESIQRDRPTLDARLEKERADYEEREQLLNRIRDSLRTFLGMFSYAPPEAPQPQAISKLGDELEIIGLDEAKRVSEDLQGLSDIATRLGQQLADARTQVTRTNGSLQALESAFEERNQRYRVLRHEQEILAVSLEQEDRIRAQLRRMIQLRETLKHREVQLKERLAYREQLRLEVNEYLDEIHRLRIGEVEKVNADLGGSISLLVVQGAQSNAYIERLFSLLQGTRLKRQREIAARIAELLAPAELIDLIEQEHASQLAEIVGLDESQASRITNHFLDNIAEVHKLETLFFDDQLEITMNIGGEIRRIEQLSRGQMATALLPLILRSAEFPLVFDQPEDDLDNSFIFDQLIEKIRKLKQTRQLVFVTHNANIPVLGDADRVIAMQMANARQAAPPAAGSIDQMRIPIVNILEGGAKALNERLKRYKDAV